jgi:hypothetical protein
MLHVVHRKAYFSLHIVLAVDVVIMLICVCTLVVSQSTFNSDDACFSSSYVVFFHMGL